MSVMGYDLEALVREIEVLRSKTRLVASDVVRLSFGAVARSQAMRAVLRAGRRHPAPQSWGGDLRARQASPRGEWAINRHGGLYREASDASHFA